MSDELKLRTASESVGWLNSVGPLDVAPPRSVFEAFGHHDYCNVWVETPESYHPDRSRPCTCGGDK